MFDSSQAEALFQQLQELDTVLKIVFMTAPFVTDVLPPCSYPRVHDSEQGKEARQREDTRRHDAIETSDI